MGAVISHVFHHVPAVFDEFQFADALFADEEKAREMVKRINKAAETDGARPLVFDTIVNSDIREIIATAEKEG